jgi:hypothetical protein
MQLWIRGEDWNWVQAYALHMQIEGGRLPGNNPPKMEVREETTNSNQQERRGKEDAEKNLICIEFNYRPFNKK